MLRPFAAGDLGAVAGMLRCPDVGPDHDADADGAAIGWLTAYGRGDRQHPGRDEGGGGVRDVWADARTDNLASLAVLRRAGFTEWAREKQPDGRECGHLRIARDTDRVAAAVISVCPALQVPTLRSDWVVLRPWRRDDAPRIVEACSDRVSQHFLADLPRDYGHDDALAFVDACHLVRK